MNAPRNMKRANYSFSSREKKFSSAKTHSGPVHAKIGNFESVHAMIGHSGPVHAMNVTN